MKYEFKLKELREKKGITQEDLAIKFNVTRQTIGRWERKEVIPSMAVLTELAIFFRVGLDDIFSLPKKKPKGNEDTFMHEYVLNHFDFYSEDNVYFGNIGIKLKNKDHSLWLPVSETTFERVREQLLESDFSVYEDSGVFCFKSLNNKLIVFSLESVEKVTFLKSEQENRPDDWVVDYSHEVEGFDDVFLNAVIDTYHEAYEEDNYPENYSEILNEWLIKHDYKDEEGEIDFERFSWLTETVLYYVTGNKETFNLWDDQNFLDDYLFNCLDVFSAETDNGEIIIQRDSIAFLAIPLIAID